MKNYLSIFFIILFFSCENDIEINDTWKDIPVIYAILNSGTQEDADGYGFEDPNPFTEFDFDGDTDSDLNNLHFVRVQKSFLGEESAYNYMNISDSIYYDNNNLSVWAEVIDPNYLGSVNPAQISLIHVGENELEQLGIDKLDGNFSIDNHYLYRFPNINDINFNNPDPNVTDISDLCQGGDCNHLYKICVLNNLTGDTAYAITNIVQPLEMFKPHAHGPTSILKLGLESTPFQIDIQPSINAKMYSVSLRFNYLEQSRDSYLFDVENGNALPTTGVVAKYVDWTFSEVVITDQNQLNGSGNRIKKSFYGAEFFTYLKSTISEQDASQPEFYRYPINTFYQNFENSQAVAGIYHRCIDLNITAVNTELYTFLNANAPNYGLNQERPEYNNVENGIGHVSSRSVLNMNNLRIDKQASDSLSFGQITKNLNFACFSNLGTGYLDINFGYYCDN
jgi:hypothetical protein